MVPCLTNEWRPKAWALVLLITIISTTLTVFGLVPTVHPASSNATIPYLLILAATMAAISMSVSRTCSTSFNVIDPTG